MVATTPVSIRLPILLSNELNELSITLDRSKSYLISEFIKAGITETNAILAEKALITEDENEDQGQMINERIDKKSFMLNTNYNNNEDSHFDMLKSQEAVAFCKGWKEYICQLSIGDTVFCCFWL